MGIDCWCAPGVASIHARGVSRVTLNHVMPLTIPVMRCAYECERTHAPDISTHTKTRRPYLREVKGYTVVSTVKTYSAWG